MDKITKKLVETVHTIINEGAARGAAAIFAGMTDAQFEDYITNNPGTKERAQELRAQGLGGQGRPQSQSRPNRPAYTVNSPEYEGTEGYFTKLVDRWHNNPEQVTSYDLGSLERQAARIKNPEIHQKLINHPDPFVQSWASRNPLTTPEQLNKLLTHPDSYVRISAIHSPSFSKQNMQTVFDTTVSGINSAKNEEDKLEYFNLLKRSMHTHPHLYTTDMHQALINHENSHLRNLAQTWIESGKHPVEPDYKRVSSN
jgi:hypothetical protein